MVMYCCIPGCNNTSGKGVKMHRFPLDEDLFRQWVVAAQNPKFEGKDDSSIRTSYRVCHSHFGPEHVIEHGRRGSNLKYTAVPNINLVQKEVDPPRIAIENIEPIAPATCDTEITSSTEKVPIATNNNVKMPHLEIYDSEDSPSSENDSDASSDVWTSDDEELFDYVTRGSYMKRRRLDFTDETENDGESAIQALLELTQAKRQLVESKHQLAKQRHEYKMAALKRKHVLLLIKHKLNLEILELQKERNK